MRKHFSTILLVLILMTGLSLLLYPTVSDAWNALHQTRAIDSYTANVARINDARYREILDVYKRQAYRLVSNRTYFEFPQKSGSIKK